MKNSLLKKALQNLEKSKGSKKDFKIINPEILTPNQEGKVFGGCDHCKKDQVVKSIDESVL